MSNLIYKRGQIEWALWRSFRPLGSRDDGPPPIFKTRIKRLLDLDRELDVSQVAVKTDFLGNETVTAETTPLTVEGTEIRAVTLDSHGTGLYAGTANGRIFRWTIGDPGEVKLMDDVAFDGSGLPVTQVALVFGDISLAAINEHTPHVSSSNHASVETLFSELNKMGISKTQYQNQLREEIALHQLQQQQVISHLTLSSTETQQLNQASPKQKQILKEKFQQKKYEKE